MTQKYSLLIKAGNSIKLSTLKGIDIIWSNAFGGHIQSKHISRAKFKKDLFFIYYLNNEILSIGRLTPVKIYFLGRDYNIQGIGGIVSVIKGKGYGKILMKAIHNYLIKNHKTGVGFCTAKNSPFYKKCKFKIAKGLVKRFLYKNSNGKLISNNFDNDVLYLDGKDKFMRSVLDSKERVILPCEHW